MCGGRFLLLKADLTNYRQLSLGFRCPFWLPWPSGLLSPRSNNKQYMSEIYIKNNKSFRNLNSWTVQSQCSNVEATASTRAVAPHTKLYIPCNINPRRKLLNTDIWTDKKWTGFWHNFNYNLVFYLSHNPMWMPEDFVTKNCSDLLGEKIVLAIEKHFWISRLKAKNSQFFWDQTVKGQNNFRNRMLF